MGWTDRGRREQRAHEATQAKIDKAGGYHAHTTRVMTEAARLQAKGLADPLSPRSVTFEVDGLDYVVFVEDGWVKEAAGPDPLVVDSVSHWQFMVETGND